VLALVLAAAFPPSPNLSPLPAPRVSCVSQQSVKGRAQMHQQAIAAIEGGGRGKDGGKAGATTGND